MKRVLRFCLIALMLTNCDIKGLMAADINVHATVDQNRVELGSAVLLTVTVHGTQQADHLSLPPIDGMQARGAGSATSFSFNNGQVSSSLTYRYYLVPTKEGQFKIPPVTVTIDGQNYTTEEIPIEVIARGSMPAPSPNISQMPSAPAPATESLEDKIFLVLEIPQKKVYLAEKVPVTVKLYVRNINAREIQMPQLEQNGFSMDEYQKPKQYQQSLGGILYNLVEFNTFIYPTQTGQITPGPATVNCNVLFKTSKRRPAGFENFDNFFNGDIFDDFFGGFESIPYTVQAASLTLDVEPLPADAPKDFSGAIGQFDFQATASPSEVSEGDPITLKMQISGEGNLKGISFPSLKDFSDFKVYDPRVKEENGAKIIEQVLIPKSVNVKDIPEIFFTYFDPQQDQYKTIKHGPFDIVVKKGDTDSMKIVDHSGQETRSTTSENFGKDIIFIKEYPGEFQSRHSYFIKNPWLYIVVILYLILLTAVSIIHFRKERLKSDIHYSKRLKAPVKAKEGLDRAEKFILHSDQKQFYDTLYRTLQEYFRDHFRLPAGDVTVSILEQKFKENSRDSEILAKVKNIFDESDAVRFGAVSMDKTKMESHLSDARHIIDRFERGRK